MTRYARDKWGSALLAMTEVDGMRAKAIDRCVFCGDIAGTKEHVIPKWLLNHFGLIDQKLGLWNETTLPYRQAVVPACPKCNNERFSRLESKVKAGEANEHELYLWALKLRYGLTRRDSSLPLDRRSKDSPSLIDAEVAALSERTILAKLASVWAQRPVRFQPFPFGSVFRFKLAENSHEFQFLDLPPPWWAIGVTLPGKTLLVVLFTDRGVVRRYLRANQEAYSQLRRAIKEADGEVIRFVLFRLVQLQTAFRIPKGVVASEGEVRSERVPRRIPTREPQLMHYRRLAADCWLDDEVARDAFHAQAKSPFPERIRLPE